MQVGFSALRGFVIQRPSMRAESLNVLLELTTHSERKIRGAAINTVKLWMPNTHPMADMIKAFALQMLRKLQIRPPRASSLPKSAGAEDVAMENGDDEASFKVQEDGSPEQTGDQDDNMEDGQLPPEDLVHTPYLPERIELPAQKSHVLQHVELLFALSVKVPEFLDECVPLSFLFRY